MTSGLHASVRTRGSARPRASRARTVRRPSYSDAVPTIVRAVGGPDHRLAPVARCPFCAAIEQPQTPAERPVLQDDRFVAWVSRGALVEGHLLVIPRRHELNLQRLSSDERHALSRFVAAVKDLLDVHYGPSALFEHGPVVERSAVGCSIDHAHLHVLPWIGSLIQAAETDHPHLPWERVADMDSAWHVASGGAYLVATDPDGTSSVAVDGRIGSQALRRTIATATGRGEEWDWKVHPRTTTVLRTISRLTT